MIPASPLSPAPPTPPQPPTGIYPVLVDKVVPGIRIRTNSRTSEVVIPGRDRPRRFNNRRVQRNGEDLPIEEALTHGQKAVREAARDILI